MGIQSGNVWLQGVGSGLSEAWRSLFFCYCSLVFNAAAVKESAHGCARCGKTGSFNRGIQIIFLSLERKKSSQHIHQSDVLEVMD